MRARMVTVVLASALAGCAGTQPSEEHDDPRGEPAWPFAVESTCDDATIGFLQDIDRVQGLLPAGFTAADAAAFLDVAAPTGQGFIAITTIDCTSSSIGPGSLGEAEIAILVEPPRLTGAEVEAGATLTTYFAAILLSSEAYHARLAPWGHDIGVASVSNEIADPPQSGPLTITIDDEQGSLMRFTAAAPATTSTPNEFVDNWQLTSSGLLHGRSDLVARDFGAGTAVSCSIREGSRSHEVFGFTGCEG